MKYDDLEFKVRDYLRQGTQQLKQQNFSINIVRSHRSNYIGMSSLTQCARLIWTRYHHPNFIKNNTSDPERTLRIFDLGHIIEDYTIKILIAGGATLNQSQLEFSDFDGQLRGHVDAILDDECVCEIKSMNDSSYASFVNLGIQTSHPTYYVQMQMYMHYAHLQHAVLVATNKNTSEIECEHVQLNNSTVEYHLDKVKQIVNAKNIFDLKQYITPQECYKCPLNKICN